MTILTRPWIIYASVLILTLLIAASSQSRAQDCCDPASPFAPGEDYPQTPATCGNIAYWAQRAPQTNARISMAITGELTAADFDGVLAYLAMCEPNDVQVICITYSTNGLEAGDHVLLAGGYNSAGENRVVLDPCLASRE